MRIIRWLAAVAEKADANLDSGTPLSLADIPRQRSLTPSQVIDKHLMPSRVELVGTYPCCDCCLEYIPQPCPAVHRDPCDKHQRGDVA